MTKSHQSCHAKSGLVWPRTTLSQLSSVVRGASPRPAGDPKYFNGDFTPWLTVAALTNIPESQLTVLATAGKLTEAGAQFSRTLKPGTVIIANSGATLGVAKILGIRCCANDGIAALLDLQSGVDARYVAYQINSQTDRLRTVVATGNGQPNLNTGLIGAIEIDLPCEAEQSAIADALGANDALIDSLEQLLTKKRQIKQGAMQELLTCNRRLEGFQREWRSQPFDAVLERINAKRNQVQASEYQSVGALPVIDQGQTTPVAYSDAIGSRFVCPAGGALIFGDHTCVVKFVNFDFVVGADGVQVLIARPGQSTRFHAYQLELNGIESTGYNRHFKFLQERRFLCPAFDEQEAIAQVLSDTDIEIAALESRLTKARALKQAMAQALLTGRIRLVEEGAAA